MPDFCYHSGSYAPQYKWSVDYVVPWNRNITQPNFNIQNDTYYDGLMCTKNFTMEIFIEGLTNYGTDPIPGPGINLAGSLIAPGLSGDGYDAFYPVAYGVMNAS